MFCNHLCYAPTAENYVKSCFKKCQIHKKMLGEIAALNYVTFGKLLIIIPAFCVFMTLFLDIPATADVPRFGKILKRMPNCVH